MAMVLPPHRFGKKRPKKPEKPVVVPKILTMSLSPQFVSNYLLAEDYSSLCEHLNISFKATNPPDCGVVMYEYSEEGVKLLLELLNFSSQRALWSLLEEVLRSLRNYVINPQVAFYALSKTELVKILKILIAGGQSDLLPMILQLLVHLAMGDLNCKNIVYSEFKGILFDLLQEDRGVYHSCAVLYNISISKRLDLSVEEFTAILELYESSYNEYLMFLIEQFVTYDWFWELYGGFRLSHRVAVLSVFRDQQLREGPLQLSGHIFRSLEKRFMDSSGVIFQTVESDEPNLAAEEVALLLEVIASLLSKKSTRKVVVKEFVVHVGAVLINVHRLGKGSENYFSGLQRLADVTDPNEVIRRHPAFGFKVGLVRVIANVVCSNSTMQDLVRTAEVIPVILDCCNVDARNPFIMQWAILAIRNLCEYNLENRKFISSLHQEGVVTSETLEEFGLTLENNGNQIKIVPLADLKGNKKN